MNTPNILFLFSDQQRWDSCGCYGQPLDLTPNLDQMAREGVCFEHAFTCQPVCGPARAAVQTGRYPTEIGCHINHRRLPAREKTLAHFLGGHGYRTGYIGKWHLASCGPLDGPDDFRTKPIPLDRRGGYDDFWLAADVLEFTSHAYDGAMFDAAGQRRAFPPGRYRADVLTDWTLEYLHAHNREQPFFLFVSFIEPHHQNDHQHFEGPHGSKDRFSDFVPPGDLVGTAGDWREEYPDYLGCVNRLDHNLGRIRATLRELDLAENTLVIYTSDHGCHFRTRNAEYKRSCHDADIRIPMVLRGPGFTGGHRIPDLVSLIDLPPTILQAAGIVPPATMRGQQLPVEPREPVPGADDTDIFLQISESHCGRALRTSRWKYSIRAPEKDGNAPSSDVYLEDFLYDLHTDPHERDNRVGDPALATTRTHLSRRLKQRMVAAGEAEPTILPVSGNPDHDA